MRLTLPLMTIALSLAAPAVAAAPAAGCKDAAVQQGKAPTRKPAETRKRPASSSVGRGCVGCVLPLDGMAATMAVRQLS